MSSYSGKGVNGLPVFKEESSSVKLTYESTWDPAKPATTQGAMTKFKMFLWAAAVCLIISGSIAAIVILVVDNENKNANKPPSPPPPPFPPGYRFPPPPPPPPPPKSSPDTPPFPAPTGYEWVFYDEFNVDGKPNPKKWGYDIGTGDTGWGNNEAQYYTNSPSNSKVEDGSLVITALREQYQYMQYTSARLTTKGKASFYPGSKYSEITIEASIKAPGPTPAMGIWGAFWMLPEDNKYGAWPSSGEIDIFEIINGMTGMTQGVQFGPPGDTNPGENEKYMTTTPISSGTYSDTYHTYKVEWTPEAMTFYIDGTAVLQAVPRADNPKGWFTPKSNNPAAPFDAPFYLIANIAVGGTYPNGGYNTKYPDQDTPFPNNMYVDYIRVLGKTA